VKPNINSGEVHSELCNNGHPVDGALVGAGSLWPNPKRKGRNTKTNVQSRDNAQKGKEGKNTSPNTNPKT
jgi:hypothetical protein